MRQNLRQRGFSLVELLVGIVLAMIAIIVVMQIFRLSESSNRTTAGAGSVAMDGAIAVTDIQRYARQAGEGFILDDLLGCDVTLFNGYALTSLAPITINSKDVPAGDTGTDTLLIVTGNGFGGPEGDRVTGVPTATQLNVVTPNAFTANDFVIPAPETRVSPCGLKVNKVVSVTGVAPNGTVNVSAAAAANSTAVYDIGRNPRVIAYAVRSGRLTQCDYMVNDCSKLTAGNWVELYDNVVSLRAEYGNISSTPPVYNQTTPTTLAAWKLIGTVRFVLVMRSGQLEVSNGVYQTITTAAPTWAGSTNTPVSLVNLTNWQSYRYRTFEAVVPMRNVVNANS
jgi:type IV pilus assembly protein PilW